MPYRKVEFVDNNIYHIVNRSIAKFNIFNNYKTNYRFIDLMRFYQHKNDTVRYSSYNELETDKKSEVLNIIRLNEKYVEILCFSLMPNHYHLLIKQKTEDGISTFMRLIQNSYAKYFNSKFKRKGPLFESSFKAIKIENDEQLVHVSRYIHINITSANIIPLADISNYLWSSYNCYCNNEKIDFINKKIILDYFKDKNDYEKFIKNHADYQKKLQYIKKLTLE